MKKIRHLARFNSADGPLFIGKYSLNDEIFKLYMVFLCLFKVQRNNNKI